MEKGKVKWFSAEKGYGFITKTDGSGDVFAHWSGILMDGYKKLEEGQTVIFDIDMTEKGPQATNISVIWESDENEGQG